MPDPGDRIRIDPRPARAKPAPARHWARALAPRSKRSVAAAALVAMMIGIVVNALALQHGRRVEFAADPTGSIHPPAPAPTPAATTVASAPPEAPAPTPPNRPTPTPVALAHPAKSADAIADFLRSNGADKRRQTVAAQTALAKLGFSVKPTGALDAETRNALAEYEKKRHLPASTQITAKLVKTLTAAAAAK